MSLKLIVKTLKKAVPIIVANAPALIEIVKEVKKAVKKPKAPKQA